MNPVGSNYDQFPEKLITDFDGIAVDNYADICGIIRERAGKGKHILVIDCYTNVDIEEIIKGLSGLKPVLTVLSDACFIGDACYEERISANLTDDRVFGVMMCGGLEQFVDESALNSAQKQIEQIESGIVLVIGVGAALITGGGTLIYCDLARWEIQSRFKAGGVNWKANNENAPFLEKYKRGFFVEWRLADRHKRGLFDKLDFFLDTNRAGHPKMISGQSFRDTLEKFSKEPFRTVPYFDPGIWGGQWMKEKFDLPDAPNYAWSFDGVPEENSLYARFRKDDYNNTTTPSLAAGKGYTESEKSGALERPGIRIEFPAMDVTLYRPVALLGDRVHARFGAEFPIRFDLLDTVGGGNLSLQVHPLTEYIGETFGMHYTQDESYYILDTKGGASDPCVYLGLKEGVDQDEMIAALHKAQNEGIPFPVEKYINKYTAKKHDHFLIPAGTVHCSGKDTMVLEISATPYIFTFKLWDWGRMGLDGKPRPIHIRHGGQNIQWDRDTGWVNRNLVGQAKVLSDKNGVLTEKTGLHEREFIETVRHTSAGRVYHETAGSVNVLNLVEGAEAVVESPDGSFAPFTVHYAETFIIPESVGRYSIRPGCASAGEKITTIKASVR